jgi:hypothetical protein
MAAFPYLAAQVVVFAANANLRIHGANFSVMAIYTHIAASMTAIACYTGYHDPGFATYMTGITTYTVNIAAYKVRLPPILYSWHYLPHRLRRCQRPESGSHHSLVKGWCPNTERCLPPLPISILPTCWRKVLCCMCHKDAHDISFQHCMECHFKENGYPSYYYKM